MSDTDGDGSEGTGGVPDRGGLESGARFWASCASRNASALAASSSCGGSDADGAEEAGRGMSVDARGVEEDCAASRGDGWAGSAGEVAASSRLSRLDRKSIASSAFVFLPFWRHDNEVVEEERDNAKEGE